MEEDTPLKQQASKGAKPSYMRALRNRSLFYLWISQLISQSGDYIFEVALLWLVVVTTKSATAVGIAVAVMLVPNVVVGPVAGVFVDRFNRRDAMIAANVYQGIVVVSLSALFLFNDLSFPLLLILLFMLSTGAQFTRSASNALIPSLVGPDDLGPANGLFSISSNFNQLASMGLGGIVVAIFGVATPILYDGATFFVAAVVLFLVPRLAASVRKPLPIGNEEKKGFFYDLREGFGYIRRNQLLMEVIGLAVILNFFAAMVSALMAPYVRFVLGGNAAAFGFLGACVALGAIGGAFFAGKIDMRRFVGPMLFAGIIAIGAAMFIWGFTQNLYIALAMGTTVGAGGAITNLPFSVLLQAKVPSRLLGRVTMALIASVTAATPLAAFVAGALVTRLSVGQVYELSGVIILVVSVVGYVFLKDVREARF
jgi:DHA3 family macrolide efflux protein-like MFS transporter